MRVVKKINKNTNNDELDPVVIIPIVEMARSTIRAITCREIVLLLAHATFSNE